MGMSKKTPQSPYSPAVKPSVTYHVRPAFTESSTALLNLEEHSDRRGETLKKQKRLRSTIPHYEENGIFFDLLTSPQLYFLVSPQPAAVRATAPTPARR
ncbi:unnamed protein product [Toxocara canis]|uniref:TEX36 n=1 Tax=Toxocara canis TaxID=6265 RepID=A0A183VD45_TOXCA|nr:unnamed protein product [Toxocara canis]